jgi:hypothetical protein
MTGSFQHDKLPKVRRREKDMVSERLSRRRPVVVVVLKTLRLARRHPVLPIALIALTFALTSCVSPAHYHYPRLSEEADLALERLETTVEVAEQEKAATPMHLDARAAAKDGRAAVDGEKLDAIPRALDAAAARLDAVAERTRRAIPPERDGPQRDRLFDLERQAARAAREMRTLRRAIGGLPSEPGALTGTAHPEEPPLPPGPDPFAAPEEPPAAGAPMKKPASSERDASRAVTPAPPLAPPPTGATPPIAPPH